jgi:hypothetical protein
MRDIVALGGLAARRTEWRGAATRQKVLRRRPGRERSPEQPLKVQIPAVINP